MEMSRSYRRTPLISFNNRVSDKDDKCRGSRKTRRAVRQFLGKVDVNVDTVPLKRELANVRDSPKDGCRKWFDGVANPKLLRK